jgi:predicted ATP-grasp superfamily ATP-dependent carboligase
MSGAALQGTTPEKVETAASRGSYDILIVDGAHKQSLTSARTLTKRGLRVAVAEADGQFQPGHRPPTFQSNACAHSMVLPDFVTDPDGYAEGVVRFVRDNGVRVVLPVGDASIAVLAPHRERLAELGCFLAVASDAALEIANDKTRTLEIAAKLDIDYPRSLPVAGPDDLLTAAAQFGYPYILKPTVSWTGVLSYRVVPVEVMNETEGTEALERYFAAGCQVIAQQMATGDREGVSLFIVNGEVLGYCGCLAHRTTPPMGGVSAMRESIPVSPEMLNAAVSLATTIGVEGPSEVEFRRDASGRPLLMEINARLAGTLENAMHSGVNFPLMIWQWGSGQPVTPVTSYKTGVRTRWLAGDLRWLWDSVLRPGRPGSVTPARGLWTFTSEFFRTRHYDFVDRRDMRPALAEVWDTAGIVKKQWDSRKEWREEQQQSGR